MRVLLPLVIVLVGLGALAVNVLPLPRPGGGMVETRLGLDLQGGVRGEYRAMPDDPAEFTQEDLSIIRDIVENRINQYGVAEPIVQTQGRDRIIVELPGVENEGEIRGLIGQTGRLEFFAVPRTSYPTGLEPNSTIPPDLRRIFGGEEIANARAGVDRFNSPAVDVELRAEGAATFDEYARLAFRGEGRSDFVAITLDGQVQSAPEINAQRFGGRVQISGRFTPSEVSRLVTVLRYGALPAQLEEVSISRISPTLGLNFLQQSVLAGSIGILLVFAFMLIHYRLPGLIACLALVFYALVVFAIFRLVPVTLTLAGVAAFVLSVGMAVDANILIFERTKEELRSGKTLFTAIEAGFNRAWNSIFDSNVSSIITAAILFYFGSPVIRGFALVLIIGVLISMFTAITLSRQMLRWVVRQPWARRAWLYGVEEEEFTVATPRARGREAARV
ncbi:MAG TPA: protein translocase subunit SecD [Candidatus Limnocylindrales bacterium]|jgi:preprotein translocase subunit SecD|nr:protein translocase subunit SecD [Candidatus Limnocylindrales bacterium]